MRDGEKLEAAVKRRDALMQRSVVYMALRRWRGERNRKERRDGKVTELRYGIVGKQEI